MANRLRELREKTLKMSLDAFAHAVGERIGKSEKWYLQRVARIENGETRLNEEMIEDICKAFPQIEPWHLFTDPLLVASEGEKKLLEIYRGLDEGEKAMYLHTLESFSRGKGKKPDAPDAGPSKENKKP